MTATRYRYRAANATGALVEGEIDAASEQGAIDVLRQRSLWATDVWPREVPRKARVRRDVPAGALATTTRVIATLLASGVSLDSALRYASTQSPAEPLRAAFATVRNDVRNGRAFSDALRVHHLFPPLFSALAATGEETGSLDTALARLAEHFERTDELRSRLQSALLYPLLLASAAFIGVAVIMLVVVPRFAVLLEQTGSAPPVSTRILMTLSRSVTAGWPIILLLTAAAFLWWRQWYANPQHQRQFHATRLTWPILGNFERVLSAARYTRTLALTLPSGVSLLAAMQLSRMTVQNVALRDQLEAAEAQVRAGHALASATESALPPLASELLAAGEAAGALPELAARAADALDAETQRALSRAITLVEPTMILLFGAVIGFVALGLLQAIYGINASTL